MIGRYGIVQLTAALCGLFFSSVCPSASARDKHLVTLDDLLTLKHIGWHIELSPDGKTLAYNIEGEETLWLVNMEQRTSREVGHGKVPRWAPDGKQLAFYSRQSGTLQLWAWNLKSGSSTQLTQLHGGINPDPTARLSGSYDDLLHYSWSPDGKRIVFTSAVSSETTKDAGLTTADTDSDHKPGIATGIQQSEDGPLVLTNTTPPSWTLANLFQDDHPPEGTRTLVRMLSPPLVNQLFTVDISTKTTNQLTSSDDGYFNPDWSPDGTKIAYVSTEGRPMTGYGPDISNVHVFNIATGQNTAITKGPGQKRLPSWSPDGKQIAFLGGRQFETPSLFVLSDISSKPLNLTADLDRAVYAFSWSPEGDSIIVSYQDGASWPIARIWTLNGIIEKIIDNDAHCHPYAVARSQELIWAQSDGSGQDVLYTMDLHHRDARLLFDLNPQVRHWALGKQEVVRWKNTRGDEIDGILMKPVDYQDGTRYPVIVDPYPGLDNSFMADPMGANQAFASRGYAVFIPNERTSHTWWNPVKGEAYNKATVGPMGIDIMMDDLMTGIDAIVREGVADPERICLYGFSNGGGAVNLIVTRTSRFKCAVSAAGVATDWAFSFFMSGNSTFSDLAGGVTPWRDPIAYIALSPVYHLDKVTTPMLLAIGDEEETGVVMLIEMYNGLRYLGRDVTLLRYPKQGHGFTGVSLQDYWARANAFLDIYLTHNHPKPSADTTKQLN